MYSHTSTSSVIITLSLEWNDSLRAPPVLEFDDDDEDKNDVIFANSYWKQFNKNNWFYN